MCLQNRSFFSEHFSKAQDNVDFVSKSPITNASRKRAFEFCIALRLSPLTSYKNFTSFPFNFGTTCVSKIPGKSPFTSRHNNPSSSPSSSRARLTVVLVVLVVVLVVRASFFDIVPFIERRRASFFEASSFLKVASKMHEKVPQNFFSLPSKRIPKP
jgi:hypothetical protein